MNNADHEELDAVCGNCNHSFPAEGDARWLQYPHSLRKFVALRRSLQCMSLATNRTPNLRMDRSGGLGPRRWLDDWPPPGHPCRYPLVQSVIFKHMPYDELKIGRCNSQNLGLIEHEL